MWLDAAIGCLGILVLANYRFRRSVLYPPFIFCLVWLLDLTIYSLNLIDINPLHSGTLVLIVVGACLFSLGGASAFFVPSSLVARRFSLVSGNAEDQPKPQYLWFKYFLIIVLLLILFLQIKTMLSFAAQAPSAAGGLLMRARSAGVENINDNGTVRSSLTYLGPWIPFTVILFQIEATDWFFKSALIIALINCIVGTGRIEFLFLFSSLTCVFLIQRRRERFVTACRFARWPILAFFMLFFVVLFTVKDNSGVQGSIAKFAGDSLVQYVIGPTGALDYVLRHPHDYIGLPNHTFKLFLTIASAFGLTKYTSPPALDSFLFIPFAANVYTVYKFFFTDFGIYATAAIMAFLGFGHTLLYRKARTNSKLGLYFFALTIFTVLMVIFDDWYTAYGRYVDALVFGMVYFLLRSVPLGLSLKLKIKKSGVAGFFARNRKGAVLGGS
jgi:oligosaccharide repeat unit polymerase